MHVVLEFFAPLRQAGARFGPYVLLELLLPGGTLFALLLFLHQRVKASGGGSALRPATPPVLVGAVYAAARDARSPAESLEPSRAA